MVKFICDHPGVIAQLLGVLGGLAVILVGALGTLLAWLYKHDLRMLQSQLIDLKVLLEKTLEEHNKCKADLSDKFVKVQSFENFLIDRREERKEDRLWLTGELEKIFIEIKKHRHALNGDML